jgi:hypothetical protein
MKTIKLDSAVDVKCDFCSRTGKRGYILADDTSDRPFKEFWFRTDVSSLAILCPACFTFLYGKGGWKPGEAWEKSEVSWNHVNMPGDKNE